MYNLMSGYKLSSSEKKQMNKFAEQFIGLSNNDSGSEIIAEYEFDGNHLNFYDKDFNLLSRLSVYELFHYDVIQRI